MTYRDKLIGLGDSVEEKVANLYALMDAGELTEAATVELMSVLIGKHRAQAIVLAEASLAAELMLALGRPVSVVATTWPSTLEPIRQGVVTTLATAAKTPDILGRLGRMARGVVYNSAARSYSEGVKKSPLTEGWTRDLEPDACQMCRWWWREGRVWPKDHMMPTHVGCTCTPKPVVSERVYDVTNKATLRSERDRATAKQVADTGRQLQD